VLNNKTDFETFFAQAPRINPNVSKITGMISREAAVATGWRTSRTR
jgi:hypothetical protein